MKIKIVIGIVAAAVLALGITYAVWPKDPKAPRGEHEADLGFVYYFGDGVVAVDTTLTPNQYFIYANRPDQGRVKKAELIKEGFRIHGMGDSPKESEEYKHHTDGIIVTYDTSSVEPGEVMVVEVQGRRTEQMYKTIDPKVIQDFIDRADWNASVRELWKK